MEYKNLYYPESRFGTFTDVDGTIAFYLRVNGLVDAESVVLDVGCGRGAYADDPTPVRRDLRILKGKVKKVIGIDIDESGEKNPCLDVFNLITEQNVWPLQDSSVDLCLCDNVLVLQRHLRLEARFGGVTAGTGALRVCVARDLLCAICCSGSRLSARGRIPPLAGPSTKHCWHEPRASRRSARGGPATGSVSWQQRLYARPLGVGEAGGHRRQRWHRGGCGLGLRPAGWSRPEQVALCGVAALGDRLMGAAP